MVIPALSGEARRRGGRCRPLAAGLLLLALAAAPLGAQGASYSPVTGLRLTDLFFTGAGSTLKIQWDYPAGSYTFQVRRTVGAATTTLGTTQGRSWPDPVNFQLGTDYQYSVQVVNGPSGAGSSAAAAIRVRPGQAALLENGTVDSRTTDNNSAATLSNPVYRDYRFHGSTYRGGLFAGYSGDPSRVGRSFLKFQLPAPQAGENVWTGSVQAWWTRSFGNGSVEVGCQPVASAWNAATLQWTTAPGLNPASPSSRQTLAYPGTSGWFHWAVPVCACGSVFSVGMASTNEGSPGWAYFAKREFDAAKAPALLYATGAPLQLCGVLLNPTTVYGGVSPDPLRFPSTSTGEATLNGPAPAGGATVQLSSSNPTVALVVPTTVTIPEGQACAEFEVTTLPVTSVKTVTISASYGGVTKSAVLTVKPLPLNGGQAAPRRR